MIENCFVLAIFFGGFSSKKIFRITKHFKIFNRCSLNVVQIKEMKVLLVCDKTCRCAHKSNFFLFFIQIYFFKSIIEKKVIETQNKNKT
jgi:hypothetical protein